ncbi:kelch repeat and BTB domain-containing protein 8-like [Branchiostoma lanceolatum]|uniref:kelch repeat and BTB domain-containing protein 8-like n=1 Tax=Branchiostoma lanceolatum TaxID=7740 RepID=UPI003453D382
MAAADQEPHASTVRPRSYRDESYLHGFLGTVCDLQKAGVLQDVILEVEGRRFPCHRLVMSAASPYFRAMFTSDMAESRQKTVVLQGLGAGVFGEILSYIYSGTLHVSLDKVQPLYQAADLFQLDYVIDTCSSYMAMNVERSTCVDLYKFADVFSIDTVLKRCLQLMDKNFAEVASSEEFCSLSVHQLTEIIIHDELDVKEETTVWEAVVRWVHHSREDRQHHLPSILPHIRFNLLTSDDTAAILENPLVRENFASAEVIRNVVQRGNFNTKPRLGMTTEMALVYNATRGFRELLFMNPREGKYISCSYDAEDLPRLSPMIVTNDNNIYILETKDLDDENQLSLSKYNHAKNVWEHECLSSISKGPVPDHGLEGYEEHLYEVDQILYHIAFDGFEQSPLLVMRKYHWDTKQWQKCSQLQLETTDYHAALSCGSHLYFLTSTKVHRYDPSQDRWCKRTLPMIIPEVCTAVAMGTKIFCTDSGFTQTLVYNTMSDRWQKLHGLPNPGDFDMYYCPSLFVLENQLYILLTCSNDRKEEENTNESEEEIEKLVYVYDRSADAWRDLKASLPHNKFYIAYNSQCPVARIYLPYLNGT